MTNQYSPQHVNTYVLHVLRPKGKMCDVGNQFLRKKAGLRVEVVNFRRKSGLSRIVARLVAHDPIDRCKIDK